jgi:predicted house-cleaning noncanonical NTP pyrophosphatase (MazG superfamily)
MRIEKLVSIVFIRRNLFTNFNKGANPCLPTINWSETVSRRSLPPSGKQCATEILSDTAYLDKLYQKLREELDEYLQDHDLSQLADLLEVIYAVAQAKGMTKEELEQVRVAKAEKRGGFKRKILLVGVEE